MRRKVMQMACLPVAGNDCGAAYGGGDNPGPGGPQTAIAFHGIGARELLALA